ncbi:MAG: MFS transporter, partial [Saprospiraceae bacterium]|nr:MFS transporter [Saprospiraceae bacterium]
RPANLAAMSIYSDHKQITRSVSLNRLAMNLGFTIGPSVAGWLAVTYGYKWIFYVDSISCFFAALIFFSFLKRREIEKDPEKTEGLSGAILKADPWYGAFLISVLLSGIGFVSLFTSYPVFMEEKLMMTEGVIGLWLAVNGFIIFLTEMPIVYFLEKRENTYNPMVIGMALISFALLGSMGWLPTLLMVGVYFVFITFGEILAFPFQATFSLNRASNEKKGTYMGYYGLTWSIALMVGPPTSFWVAEELGFYYLWAILGAVTLLSSVSMFFLKKRLIKS